MSYRDPYAEQYGAANNRQPYTEDFNPYSAAQSDRPTYDHGGYDNYTGRYRDDPVPPANTGIARQSTMRSFLTSNDERTNPNAWKEMPPLPKNKDLDEGFDGEFSASHRRKNYGGSLWTRGSPIRCFGRFFCCTVLIAFFLVISILLTLVLWVQPPSFDVSDVDTSNPNISVSGTSSISVGLSVNLSVTNPNYFSVSFSKIDVQLFYPLDGNETQIGSGNLSNTDFPAKTAKTVEFPFTFEYDVANDPNQKVLADLVTKCGILTGDAEDITVDYKLSLGIHALFATVSPVVSNSLTFKCPLDSSSLEGILGGTSL